MTTKISVIIPTREPDVRKNPSLQKALDSIHNQIGNYDWDIQLSFKGNQAEAVNNSTNHASYNLFAFLEDDDTWEITKTREQLEFMEDKGLDFVTSSQILMKEDNSLNGLVHFPTPSGWLMYREVWEEVGGFNEGMTFHIDTEWLLRYMVVAERMNLRRGHIYPCSHPSIMGGEGQMARVEKNATILMTKTPWPLVTKGWSADTQMGKIRNDASSAYISEQEHKDMLKLYGRLPW